MELSIDQASDLNQLLTYYLGEVDSDVSEKEALNAWRRLADAAHDKLGTGWTMRHVEKHFEPQVLDPEATYDREIECCEACEAAGGECLTHREVGTYHDEVFSSLARAMRIFEKDPEQLSAVLEQHEHNAAVSAEHQLNRQVRSVRFDSHEQIEWWAECLALEVTGVQPDRASFGGDCHGIYVGQERQLVQHGGRVEAVIDGSEVWFRPGYPTGDRN